MFVLEMEISKASIRADRALPATLAWHVSLKFSTRFSMRLVWQKVAQFAFALCGEAP
jgi:hypothetical protein